MIIYFKLLLAVIKYSMTLKLDDGINAQASDLLAGQGVDPNTGDPITFSQVGSTNTYTATVSLCDGRSVTYTFDKPADAMVRVSRTVR